MRMTPAGGPEIGLLLAQSLLAGVYVGLPRSRCGKRTAGAGAVIGFLGILDRQFCDAGSQYRPEIFYHTEEQKRLGEDSKAKWQKEKPFKQPILTPITKAGEFWPAEEYHQDYYKKNPVQYRFYVTGCGRYARLDQLWGA